MLRMHSSQPIWWDVQKVIQSNPLSCVDIWFIYRRYNLRGGSFAYKQIWFTGIRNLSGGEFKISFLSIPRIVVHGGCYYSHFLFVYFFFGFSLLVCCCFVSLFLMIKTFYAVRKHWFAVFTLIKKWKTFFSFEQAHSCPWQVKQ